jgi:hypothetical protein
VLVWAATSRAADDTAIEPSMMGPEVGKAQSSGPEPLPDRPTTAQASGEVTPANTPTAETTPTTSAGPVEANGASAPAVVTSSAGPGCGGHCDACGTGGRSGIQRFWGWLTYQPLYRPGPCGCCHECVPACNPPLYTFFPCYGTNYIAYAHGTNPGCTSCGSGGCASCAGSGCASDAGGHCFLARIRGVFHVGHDNP